MFVALLDVAFLSMGCCEAQERVSGPSYNTGYLLSPSPTTYTLGAPEYSR